MGQIRRRQFLIASGALVAAPAVVYAQASKVYRVGWLARGTVAGNGPSKDAFGSGMRELGYEVGRNLVVDMRYTNGDASLMPKLAEELVALNPDVLLGIGSACLAMAAKTSTIPIVITATNDPVALGLVQSLARPGKNVTGISNLVLVAKHIELLKEIYPNLSRVVLLHDTSALTTRRFTEGLAQKVAAAKKLALLAIYAPPNAEGVRSAFARAAEQPGSGVVVALSAPLIYVGRDIAQEASRLRIPVVYPLAGFIKAGGLLSYGANIVESSRKEIPPIVDRIFKGGNPAEMPIRQSSVFEMVVNLIAAKEIGLTIPPTVLLRADRVIE